jgi:hypothetical protein
MHKTTKSKKAPKPQASVRAKFGENNVTDLCLPASICTPAAIGKAILKRLSSVTSAIVELGDRSFQFTYTRRAKAGGKPNLYGKPTIAFTELDNAEV